MKSILVIALAVFVSLFGVASSYAVDFFTVPTIDTLSLGTMVTSILAALALLWVARKAIKMINRS